MKFFFLGTLLWATLLIASSVAAQLRGESAEVAEAPKLLAEIVRSPLSIAQKVGKSQVKAASVPLGGRKVSRKLPADVAAGGDEDEDGSVVKGPGGVISYEDDDDVEDSDDTVEEGFVEYYEDCEEGCEAEEEEEADECEVEEEACEGDDDGGDYKQTDVPDGPGDDDSTDDDEADDEVHYEG